MDWVRLIKVKKLSYDEKGLVPAIVQDDDTGDVLTLAYMNEESFRRTLSSGEVWFYSRSRQELWHKGATSGNKLIVRSIWVNEYDNSLLVKAHPTGPTCHTGHNTCFFTQVDDKDTAKI